MKTKVLMILSIIFAACSTSHKDATVMITNVMGNSGGSGTVIQNSSTGSDVLTNRHVCGVIAHGGHISSEQFSFFAVSYKVSKKHDLCIIHVNGDFGASSSISRVIPQTEDKAIIYGHPQLLPIIITEGYFSSKMVIPVGGNTRECTDEDKQNPQKALFCLLFGRLPIVELYETQVVSALIQPGSSGSGVYDAGGKIAGVVFAGAGNLGFGFIVPLEYVDNFVNVESLTAETQYPQTSLDDFLGSMESVTETPVIKKMVEFCKTPEGGKQAPSICESLLGKTVIIGD